MLTSFHDVDGITINPATKNLENDYWIMGKGRHIKLEKLNWGGVWGNLILRFQIEHDTCEMRERLLRFGTTYAIKPESFAVIEAVVVGVIVSSNGKSIIEYYVSVRLCKSGGS